MQTDGEVIDSRGEVFDEEGLAYFGRAYVQAVVQRAKLDVAATAGKISFLNASHFAVPLELVGRQVVIQLEDGRRLKAVVEDTHGGLYVKEILRAT